MTSMTARPTSMISSRLKCCTVHFSSRDIIARSMALSRISSGVTPAPSNRPTSRMQTFRSPSDRARTNSSYMTFFPPPITARSLIPANALSCRVQSRILFSFDFPCRLIRRKSLQYLYFSDSTRKMIWDDFVVRVSKPYISLILHNASSSLVSFVTSFVYFVQQSLGITKKTAKVAKNSTPTASF